MTKVFSFQTSFKVHLPNFYPLARVCLTNQCRDSLDLWEKKKTLKAVVQFIE